MKDQPRVKHGAMLALAAVALVAGPRPVAAGNWNVNTVAKLVGAINAANQAGGANTITLAPGMTFTLSVVNNATDGPTGLPVVVANNKLTILGNGATIARSPARGTPAFRLFDIAPGAALTVQNLTLANGLILADPTKDGCGGAILNAAGASLTVKCSVLVGNQVIGGDGAGDLGGFGFGGAICSDGTAIFDSVIFQGNQATGGATTSPDPANFDVVEGGLGYGGAISSQNLGTLTVRSCWFTGNKAIGGHRHQPSGQYDGAGVSGAIDSWGTATISGSTFTENEAIGNTGDEGAGGGYGMGGAVGSGGPLALSPLCSIQDCRFSRNQAIGADADSSDTGGWGVGGAVSSGYSQNDARITVARCSFTDNQAIGGKGGIGGWGTCGAFNIESPLIFPATATTTIAHSTFANNRAVGQGTGGIGSGGAVCNSDYFADDGSASSLMISDCTFEGNAAIASPGGDGGWLTASIAESGAVDTSGSTTILDSTFINNRAVGAASAAVASSGFFTTSFGGGLSSWGGALDIRNSRFVGNQVVGGDASLGGPAGIAMGGGISIMSGLTATIVNCSLTGNTVTGGAGSSGVPNGDAIGGGLNVGFFPWGWATGQSSAVTLTRTTVSHNQAMGGAGGGEGLGGGYAVGIGVLFGMPIDTSSVTLNGGSVVKGNTPDNAFHF